MKKNDVDVEEGDDEDTFVGNYFFSLCRIILLDKSIKKTQKEKLFPIPN